MRGILKAESRVDSWVTSVYWDPEGQDLILRLGLEVVGCVCVCGVRKELGESSVERHLLFPAPSVPMLKVLGEISF